MRHLNVSYERVAALEPYARNARTHSKKQIRQIADSIETFGFTNPVLVDDDLRIIAGHGRVAAAKLLAMDKVPIIRIENLSEAQIRAYVIADNKLAENAGWDDTVLAIELQHLSDFQIEIDPTVTGFTMAEIDLRIESLVTPGSDDDADRMPETDNAAEPVCRRGELWLLGEHRLFCGDATRRDCFEALMGNERAQMVFTDPPYNVPVDRHICGLGNIRHAEFAMASGEMSETEFIAFLETAMRNLADFSIDGSIHFLCMDWRHGFELLTAARRVYADLKNLCIWNKTNGGMGSLYRSKHELVFVLKNGTAPHINNVELGKHGRYRTNVWDYAGVNSFGKNRGSELAMHPTVKPVAMVADAIRDCSTRGGIILDCFAGSGTTVLAAERAGRRAFVMEYEPKFADVTIQRFEALTGENAIHAGSGLSFAQMTDWREIEGPMDIGDMTGTTKTTEVIYAQ